jgi:hypothetical protein
MILKALEHLLRLAQLVFISRYVSLAGKMLNHTLFSMNNLFLASEWSMSVAYIYNSMDTTYFFEK